jgi:hypothetical protein
MVHYVEDRLFDFFRRHSRREQAANLKMHGGALAFRYEGIGGLLDSIVDECVGILYPKNEARPNGFP